MGRACGLMARNHTAAAQHSLRGGLFNARPRFL